MAEAPSWEPSQGQFIQGIPLDEHRFVGAMPVLLLVAHVRDPRRGSVETASDELQDEGLGDAPNAATPALEGAKRRNVRTYAQYILETIPDRGTDVADETDGLLPAIVLWAEPELRAARLLPAVEGFVLPNDLAMEALDGRTQVAAWHILAARRPEKRDLLVPVVVHHGRSVDWARRVFFEVQTRGIKSNLSLGAIETDDPIGALAKYVEEKIEFLRGRVSPQRQLGPNDRAVLTTSALRTACTTFVLGISGVQRTLRSADGIDEAADPDVRELAVRWFSQVTAQFASEFEPERRRDSVLPTPAVMAAIGAFGFRLRGKAHPETSMAMALLQLGKVDWTRGPRWDGLAGKMTPNGLSVGGGAREYAYSALRALSHPESVEYARIRTPKED